MNRAVETIQSKCMRWKSDEGAPHESKWRRWRRIRVQIWKFPPQSLAVCSGRVWEQGWCSLQHHVTLRCCCIRSFFFQQMKATPQLWCEVELNWMRLHWRDRRCCKVCLFLCLCSTELLRRTSSAAAGSRTSGMWCTTSPVRLMYIYNTYVPHSHDITKHE